MRGMVTHWSGQKTWKLCHFFITEGLKRAVSRDLFRIFEFCKMFWIANNACDTVNWINYLYFSYGSHQGSRTLTLFAGNCLRGTDLFRWPTADHTPKVWERHVDGVFSIVHKIYLQELLEHINNLHPQTQFTKEEESNSTLPFLDTLVQRNHDKTISVKIYRKPTHTNQYHKYTSHNPTSAKQSVTTALFNRADNVVSNEKDKIEEFIQRTVKKHNRRKEQPRERPEEEPKQTKSINLPYIQGVSEQLKRAQHQSTTSKQHSTPRQPLEVYYQNQRNPYQRKTGTMLYTN